MALLYIFGHIPARFLVTLAIAPRLARALLQDGLRACLAEARALQQSTANSEVDGAPYLHALEVLAETSCTAHVFYAPAMSPRVVGQRMTSSMRNVRTSRQLS